MASTIARALSQLRWSVLQNTLTDLTNRITAQELGYQTEVEVLWTGLNGTGGQVSILSRNLRVGDVLFLQHSDGASTVTYETPIKELTAGHTSRFLGGTGVYTACTMGATPDRLTFTTFTSGYSVISINAIRIVKK
jgi:hypothetical protein